MPEYQIDSNNSLYYLHFPPAKEDLPTFVFVNALTGSTDHWEAVVAPGLRDQGFGTLSYNFRGQEKSSFDEELELTNALIVDDLVLLIESLRPSRPVLVGLSIGGLYAAQAYARARQASGLVLLNTLREINPRIAWINDALPHYVATGGAALFMGLMMPLVDKPRFRRQAHAPIFWRAPMSRSTRTHGTRQPDAQLGKYRLGLRLGFARSAGA